MKKVAKQILFTVKESCHELKDNTKCNCNTKYIMFMHLAFIAKALSAELKVKKFLFFFKTCNTELENLVSIKTYKYVKVCSNLVAPICCPPIPFPPSHPRVLMSVCRDRSIFPKALMASIRGANCKFHPLTIFVSNRNI